jgi:hypothetical protein
MGKNRYAWYRDRPDGDVGVLARLVGVRVVPVVLPGPPPEAQADQQVAVYQADHVVGPAGAEDLPVAGLVAEEADLAEDRREVDRDRHLVPGVAQNGEGGPSPGEQDRQDGDLDGVVARPPVHQALPPDPAAQLSEVRTRRISHRDQRA